MKLSLLKPMTIKAKKRKTETSGKKKGGSTKKAAAAVNAVPDELGLAMVERERLDSNCNWIFEVDHSINSRYPRFFVYNIRDNKLYK
jgi:hypothetical protein